MFNATRVVAAAALVALGGGVLLIGSPLAPSETTAPLGAEAITTAMEPVHFTGHLAVNETGAGEIEGPPEHTIERAWQSSSYGTMSDPRVTGLATATNYLETIKTNTVTFVSHAATGELVNDGGSFSISCSGAGTIGYRAAEEERGSHETCWYVGQDGYDGLTAFVVLSSADPTSGSWQAEGWIYEGDVPSTE